MLRVETPNPAKSFNARANIRALQSATDPRPPLSSRVECRPLPTRRRSVSTPPRSARTSGFIGVLIEHYAGNFPLWLAPDQVRVITIGAEDDPASGPLVKYAKAIARELRGQMVRVSTDFGNNPIKAKIQDAGQLRVHTMLVIGGRDLDAGAGSVRLHGKGPQGAKSKAEAVADILAAIRERRV